jgi:cytoskeletal protein CcmA (bactofilin family)
VIEGRVEGKVDLKQNNVTVGKSGRVRADVFGRIVTIEGEVDGNVFAREQAILRQSGAIRGNITAPRVILEDGSRFKGSIDMEPKEHKDQPNRQQHQEDRKQGGQGNLAPAPERAASA